MGSSAHIRGRVRRAAGNLARSAPAQRVARRIVAASEPPSAPGSVDEGPGAPTADRAGALSDDRYTDEAPDIQATLDLFAGEWSTSVPTDTPTVSGPAPLADDPRVHWFIDVLGPIDGWSVLELGPLEGGHTAMLEAAGASVTAVEANHRAFLRCLLVKNLLDLRATFLFGEALGHMDNDIAAGTRHDAIVASGILYHLVDPVAAVTRMAALTDRIAIWTHVHDAETIARRRDLDGQFAEATTLTGAGRSYGGRVHLYADAPAASSFCGGGRPHSVWIDRDALFTLLADLGYDDVQVAFDEPDHQMGPALALTAVRSGI